MLPDNLGNQKLRPFLSIRWKLFLALTCLIVLIHAVFVVGVLNHQKNAFTGNIQNTKTERVRFLEFTIDSAKTSLYQTVNELALVATREGAVAGLVEGFDVRYDKLLSSQRVASIDIISSDKKLLKHWGSNTPLAAGLLDQAITTGQIMSGFSCTASCFIYIIVPVKIDNKPQVWMTAQQNISPLLKRFSFAQHLEVGILKTQPSIINFNAWDEQLYNITHSNISIPILMHLSEHTKTLEQRKNYSVSAFDNEFSISFKSNKHSKYQWLFIQDITSNTQQFNSTVKNVVLLGLFSLAVSLLMLYIIVNRISHQLPLILAMSQAIGLEDDVVGNVNKTGNKRILDDELQQYDRELAKISHKMDILRQTESNNAIKLQSMVRELNQTKSFIDRLLNEQQTIILVQKLGGEIIALNNPGCKLFEIDDFNGLTYAEIFCSDLMEEDGLAALNYLYLGGETLVKAEVQWRNSKDELFVLLWVHAMLSVPGTIDPVILSICVDITAQRKAEDRLEWLAFNDPSLINYNKQVFLEYLPFAISRSLERHRILALLYCEVNGFPVGSDVKNLDLNPLIMKDLSERMSGCLRQYDMLTQLSDDHFVVILEGLSDVSDANIVTDKIISSFRQGVEVEGREFFLDITIGASYAPEHTESVPELLRNAEMAMFQAKRNRVSYLSAVMPES
ncbi:MAG: diguanylate cyclase [Oceanospirillaceae bacterium]